jgi:hypothetical protein
MNRSLYRPAALPLLFVLGFSGCDLQNLQQDVAQATTAFQQDKSLVEGFVADIKRSYAPNTPDYQQAESLYYTARKLNDSVLGTISLAASTGDRSITPDRSIEDARSAMTNFVQTATASLSPGDRALPIAAAFALLPAVHEIISRLPKNKGAEHAQKLVDQVRWRTWDSIGATSDDAKSSAKKHKAKRRDAAAE